jgi:hypothetical protein
VAGNNFYQKASKTRQLRRKRGYFLLFFVKSALRIEFLAEKAIFVGHDYIRFGGLREKTGGK